ncbi:hypothetical protein FB645_004875 [Coemansia sp. IMI 203386]|nr:hypothetical protein FB645_004875 [Coemansia sp. IMI 203386]
MKTSAVFVTFVFAGTALAAAISSPPIINLPKETSADENQHPCVDHVCQSDEVCVEEIVRCFAAPCPPIPTCQKITRED